MLKWLFRKGIRRAKALESYLFNFDKAELAYLNNLSLTGLQPSFDSLPGELSWNERVLLTAYIHAELLAALGQIEPTPEARGTFRASYNFKLARDLAPHQKLKGGWFAAFSKAAAPHRPDSPELSDEQEDRLGMHFTVLKRLFVNPERASTFPELNEIGEGEAWLPIS